MKHSFSLAFSGFLSFSLSSTENPTESQRTQKTVLDHWPTNEGGHAFVVLGFFGCETPFQYLRPKGLSWTVTHLLVVVDLLWVKTVYDVCGLACILGLSSCNIQYCLTSKESSAQTMVPSPVLLCIFDPRVKKIRHQASSCLGIFSKTTRVYYGTPIFFNGHRGVAGQGEIFITPMRGGGGSDRRVDACTKRKVYWFNLFALNFVPDIWI